MRENIFVLVFLIFFACFGFAQANFSVSVEPLNNPFDSNIVFYPLEFEDFTLKIENLSETDFADLQVFLKVPKGVAVVSDGYSDKSERFFPFYNIAPGEIRKKVFSLKVSDFFSGSFDLSVDFNSSGIAGKKNYSFEIFPSPVSFNAGFSPSGPFSRESRVFFTLSNDSNNAVSNVKIELLPDDFIVVETPAFELASVASNEIVSGKEFDFSVIGRDFPKNLFVRLFFEDSRGKHVLEKTLFFKNMSKDFFAVLFVALILVLVLLGLYFEKKGKHSRNGEKGDLKDEHH